MTKEKFINGSYFKIRDYSSSTFKYNSDNNYILKQIRYSLPEMNGGIIHENLELNIIEIDGIGFKGFTYVLDTKVEVSYKFDQLIEYIEPVK